MTLTLQITPDMASQLRKTAQELGLGADQCALQLLEERLSEPVRSPKVAVEDDPLMAMAGVDDYEPAPIDEVVYR